MRNKLIGVLVMPHCARHLGESGFYHVVTKGDGNQIIFENARDRETYLDLLESCVEEFDVDVHAYCLMGNHVHLLLEENRERRDLSAFMKKLNESYAMYFGRTSERIGHVFKDRFWSEPVESDEYFLSAVRYIHANPETAGICPMHKYPWSSYRAYCGGGSFVKTGFCLELLGGIEAFRTFNASGGNYAKPFATSKLSKHLSPDELTHVALSLLGRQTLSTIRQMTPKERIPHVMKLASAGFTESEIARLTGLGRQAVRSTLGQK